MATNGRMRGAEMNSIGVGEMNDATEPRMSRRGVMGAAAIGGVMSPLVGAGVAPATAAPAASSEDTVTLTTPAEAIVEIASGRVRGFRSNGVFVYKGVPYGADTGGKARFLPPRKPQPWTGVLDTLGFGPVSPHPPRRDWGQQQTQFVYDWDDGYAGEDCLRLNVWTTQLKSAAKRPVMVWIHGGGFVSGSSQELPSYDGENLARRGVVLVSLNHRLGPLGFMDLSAVGGEPYATSGNASVLDMVHALEWVRDNIAQFGGDPDCVTIFGQSGGGAKVSALMATPRAKGLFHRAIVQSGSFSHSATKEQAQSLTNAVLAELGGGGLERLQTVPADQLIAAGDAAIAKLNKGGMRFFNLGKPLRLPGVSWGPVVDGAVFTEHAWQTAAPAVSRDIPLLVGTTREEFRDPSTHGIDWSALEAKLREGTGDRAGAILAAFRADLPAATAGEVAGIIGGMPWRNDALRQATLKHAQGGAKVFNYWFTWQPPVLEGRPGAFHCLDLAFCFDNTARCAQATGNTANARALAAQMSENWIAFARSGDPSVKGIAWPAFEPNGVATMVFGDRARIERDPAGAARRSLLSA